MWFQDNIRLLKLNENEIDNMEILLLERSIIKESFYDNIDLDGGRALTRTHFVVEAGYKEEPYCIRVNQLKKADIENERVDCEFYMGSSCIETRNRLHDRLENRYRELIKDPMWRIVA